MGTLQKSALSSPGVSTKIEKISKMKAVAVLLLAGLALASASALPKSAKSAVSYRLSYEQDLKTKGVGCDICTLVVTEIDKLLAADETMDSVVQFVEQLCTAIDGLFPGSGATCNAL